MPHKIVFINQATGYLTIDIINAFAEVSDEVAFIYGDIRIQDDPPFPGARRSKIVEKTRKSNRARFSRWLIASIQVFFLLITRYRKYEIFYFSVPPFAYLSSLILRRKFSLLMWDVYPEALKLAGIKETNPVYRVWAGFNRRLFKRAYRLYTTGEGQARLMEKYAPRDKVEIINLWSGLKGAGPVVKEINPFIREHGLDGKFIVEYSGNMGGTHNIEAIMRLAELLVGEKDIVFLLIGRGTKMETVRSAISEMSLPNVLLLPFQPDNVIKYSLAAADLSVVLVEENAGTVSVPSKIYNLLAVGSPLLAISPPGSEVERLMERYKPGGRFQPDELNEICTFIKAVKNSPEIIAGYRANALKASEDFTALNARKFVVSYLSNRQ